MKRTAMWTAGLVRRRPAVMVATAGGISIAVAMLASIGTFLSASKSSMTRHATQSIAVDWQVEVQPGNSPARVLSGVRRDPLVAHAQPVAFASTTGFQATVGGTTQTTGPGKVLGILPSYGSAFPGEMRSLVGAHRGVLLAQQTAANLHAAPGDKVSIGRQGLPPVSVTVAGVVDLPQADSLFQKVGAPPGSQLAAPPDNVVILPLDMWHKLFDPMAAASSDQVDFQVHATLHGDLPPDPSVAYVFVTGAARHLELQLIGSGVVGDNLGATLSAARSDALYAQVLFLFLGAPGAVLAGLTTAAIAATASTRRRQQQGVLRARGATSRQLVGLAVQEAVVVGVIGDALGIGLSLLVGWVAFGTIAFGATATSAVAWSGAGALMGLVIAAATVALPAWRDARSTTVAASRRMLGRPGVPLWSRLWLDLWVLAASGLSFWLTSRNGYQLVLAPEGTPRIAVNYWAFAGPLLLWVGAGLFIWRLARSFLTRFRPVVGLAVRPVAGHLSGTVAAALSRQRLALSRAVVLVGLALAFAASTATFNSTYRQQSEADARLTNGGDVTVVEPPTASVPPSFSAKIAAVPGVAHVEPLQHRFAYVGQDLQDLYGVDPSTVASATRLQDAYFQGGTARQLMSSLGARPDGVLVSAETVRDYQLSPGDIIRFRLTDHRTNKLTTIPFRYVGIASKFPTAPLDSFLVANASYVSRMTHSAAVGEFLITTSGASPRTVASHVQGIAGSSAKVTNIQSTRQIVGSSLTAVDLSGLSKVELGFAVLLASAAAGLVLALGLAERRRTFAIASALGARRRQLGAFVWSEIGYVGIAGLLAGATAGWTLSSMLVKVLTGVFDPPPSTLAIPWSYLLLTMGVATVSIVTAGLIAVRSSKRAPIEVLRAL